MQEQIVYLIGNAFRVYIYWKLLNTIFCAAKVKQFWIIIGFMLYFLLNSSVAIMFENFTLNILTNIIPLIALSFLYESKVTSKLFVGLSFYVVNMLADGIVYTVILITKVDSIVMSSGIATVLVTFLIELIFEYVWKKRSYHEIDKLYLMTILAVPIGSILIGVLTMYQYSIKTIIVAFVLMSFNLLIFYMYDNLQKNYEVIYEKKLLEQAVEAQHSELELLQESQNKIRYLQHDFKNHLISIVNYAKKADNQGLIHYIEEGLGFLSLHQQFVDTGNSEIDSILNYKLQEMKNKNVDLKYFITIPKDLEINVFDLNIVLGNLLNNAIEAIEKAEKLVMHKINVD